MGYVDSIYQAGRYTEAEAYEIVDDANRGVPSGAPCKEFVVLDPLRNDAQLPPGSFILSPQPREDD